MFYSLPHCIGELILPSQLHLISGLDAKLPFTVEDANRPEQIQQTDEEPEYKRVLLDTRLNNRVVDLRVCQHVDILRSLVYGIE